jgi:hypothetical protein
LTPLFFVACYFHLILQFSPFFLSLFTCVFPFFIIPFINEVQQDDDDDGNVGNGDDDDEERSQHTPHIQIRQVPRLFICTIIKNGILLDCKKKKE